jgi:hypothetical protein
MKKITRFILLLAAIVAWGNVVNATNTECAGTSTDPSSPAQGTFTLGYNYSFTTSGTDVTFTCELLDTKVGLVAYAWTYNPNFAEVAMTQGAGQSFSKTFTGQTLNSTFSVACKFAFAGGLAVTKTFTYTVGNACGASTDTQAPTLFTATKGTVGSNSVELLLNATDNSGAVAYTISYGAGPTVVSTSGVSATQKSYIVTGLTPSTAYSFSVVAKDAAGNAAANNPIVVTATTTGIPAVGTPTVDASKVISVYSDSYTNLPTVLQNWYGNTFSTVSIAGNDALKNTSVCCFGYEFTAKPVNISTMTKLHVDIYSETLPSITIGVTGVGEFKKSGIALTTGKWNSIDIALSDLVGADLANVNQLGFWDVNGSFYLDNLYFYNESTTVDTQAPTAFTATAGTVKSDEVQLLLNATDDSGLVSYSILYGSGPTVVPVIGTSGVQKSVIISGLTGSTTYNFSVTAKDATGNTAANSPIVVSATTLASLPGAPVPTFLAAKVMSLFSDTYTNVTDANFDPGWGGGPISNVTLTGNAAKKYEGFTYKGVQLASAVNASSMTKLHIDIYPITETTINVSPINTSKAGALKEGSASVGTLVANQWNSVNVLLSSIGVDMSSMDQFIFKGGTGGTFYMDNLYLYNDAPTGLNSAENSNVISCYPNPVANKLTVSAKSEISQVVIRNLVGQSVKVVAVNSIAKAIDLSAIASGNYFVTVKLANGQISTQKLVKQ